MGRISQQALGSSKRSPEPNFKTRMAATGRVFLGFGFQHLRGEQDALIRCGEHILP